MIDPMTGAEFAAIRAGIGYTRAEFAAHVGVSVQSVQHWEKGQKLGPGFAAACEALATLRGEWEADLARLLDRLDANPEDAPAIAYPRLGVDGRPDGWWRAIAFQVMLAVPDTMLEFG